SAPAQNVPPAPHSTATRAAPSASKARNASASACAVGRSTALRAAGRSRTTVVTGPARSTRTLTRPLPRAEPAGRLAAQLLHRARLLVRVALLGPRVGVHVIAVLLPEAGRVDVEELEGAQPLARLPEVQARQLQELAPAPRHRALDQAEAAERPAGRIEARRHAVGEHRPLRREVLARRYPAGHRGIDVLGHWRSL